MTSYAFSIPVGTYHPFLVFCLRSLLAQQMPMEIALLDGSGDPRVRKIADEYDWGISYRRHAPDAGQSAAIIEGWKNIRGDVLGWLNADDFLFPQALKRAAAMFDAGADLVCANSTVSDEAGAFIGYHWGVQPPGPNLLKSNIISQPSCFFLRDAVEKAGGLRADLHYTMDWDLWIRLYENGATFKYSEDAFSQVMWGSRTKTASFNKQRRDEIRAILQKYAPPSERRRILKAFARESRIDRLPIQSLRAFAARKFAKGRPSIRGLSGAGEILSEASLELLHYHEQSMSGIKIEMADLSSVESVCVNGVDQVMERQGKSLTVRERFPAATTIDVSLRMKPNRAGQFLKASWLKP